MGDHAVLAIGGDGAAARRWLIDNAPDVTVLSEGRSIEVFKGVGDPDLVAERFGLYARGYHRVLRVARTIADLEASEEVRFAHIAEAVSFRLTIGAKS